MTASCTLRTVVNSRLRLANVTVSLGLKAGYTQTGSWEQAAREGIQAACARLNVHDPVTVTSIAGNDCDTQPHDVWCAAGIATWRLLRPDAPEPVVVRLKATL